MLATLLYRGLRHAELYILHPVDLQESCDVRRLRMLGTDSKIRYAPLHRQRPMLSPPTSKRRATMTTRLHRWSTPAATTRGRGGAITPDGVYKVLTRYPGMVGIDDDGSGPHALRATAIINALENNADLEKVQNWLPLAGVKSFWPQTFGHFTRSSVLVL